VSDVPEPTELMDQVIQVIFAAGLQLQDLAPRLPDDVRPQLTVAVEDLDGSIAALRGAITSMSRSD
jgi:signal transduction histidine kinase